MIRFNGITVNRIERVITHGSQVLRFTSVDDKPRNIRFETACHLLLDAGISKEQLFWKCYGDDPDGGPLEGPHIFSVVISKLAEDLAKINIDVRTWRIAGVVFYCAVPSHVLRNPHRVQFGKHLKREYGPPQYPSAADVIG